MSENESGREQNESEKRWREQNERREGEER